jgi:hypothetical protein
VAHDGRPVHATPEGFRQVGSHAFLSREGAQS